MQTVLMRAASRREPGPRGGPSQQPREKGATNEPAILTGKLRPEEEQCFVQGHAKGLKARSPARRAPHPSLSESCSRGGLSAHVPPRRPHCADREGTAGGAGPPYLDDGRAGGGGGGGGGVQLRLRAPRRPPTPGAQSRRRLPLQPGGRGWRAGRGPGQRSALSPAPRVRPGHPFPPPRPQPRSWLPGAGLGARTRAGNRRAHVAVIGAGCWPPGGGWGQAEPPAPRPAVPSLRGVG